MIAGSMVALVTPMDAQGRLDWDALSKLVDFHLQEGTNAIVAVGTTGESATLDVNEHIEVIRHVVKQVAGRIPVIAGTGANSTREAIELTSNAKAAGADACLLVTPYYNKPTQEGLYQHFKAIAEAVDIPQILYNVPGRTACDMLPETVVRLSTVKNIIGIKEATGDLFRQNIAPDHVDEGIACPPGQRISHYTQERMFHASRYRTDDCRPLTSCVCRRSSGVRSRSISTFDGHASAYYRDDRRRRRDLPS